MTPTDKRGTEILTQLARAPSVALARQFDALFYELAWKHLRSNRHRLAARVGRYLGVQTSVAPALPDSEVDEVAHDATSRALIRVRNNAGRFDAQRGTLTDWIIGAAEFAFVEVAKEVTKARRSPQLAFVDPVDLFDHPSSNPTTEEHVLTHLIEEEDLADAANHLTEHEFLAVRLRITAGYSQAEVAMMMFGDGTRTRQIEGLLARGKAKLAKAWIERRSVAGQSGMPQGSDSPDDRSGHD